MGRVPSYSSVTKRKITSVTIIKDSSPIARVPYGRRNQKVDNITTSPQHTQVGHPSPTLPRPISAQPSPARNHHKWEAHPFPIRTIPSSHPGCSGRVAPLQLSKRKHTETTSNFVPFPTTTIAKTLASPNPPAVGWDAVPPPPERRRRRLDVRMDGYRALIAAGATAVCCLVCAVWAFSSSSSSSASKKHQRQRQQRPLSPGCCGCARCGCRAAAVNGEMAVGGEQKKAPGPSPAAAAAAAAAGASMMEQLVPEITTHALSYLDYTSLCRLSMTNSAMRRAANDDGAWKALYHKVRLLLCSASSFCPRLFNISLVDRSMCPWIGNAMLSFRSRGPSAALGHLCLDSVPARNHLRYIAITAL